LYSLIFETYGAILFDRKKPAYTFTKQIQYLKNSGSNTGENQTNPKARLNHGSMKQQMASVPKENGQQKFKQFEAIIKPRSDAGLLIHSFSIFYFNTSSISASPSSSFDLG